METEKVFKKLGFITGFFVFTSIMYFPATKFNLIPKSVDYLPYISVVLLLYLIHSMIKYGIKNKSRS